MELTSNQKSQVAKILNSVRTVLFEELSRENISSRKKFTGHVIFDVNCTNGGIASVDVNVSSFKTLKEWGYNG